MSQFLRPLDYSLPGSSVHGIFQQEYWSGLPFPPPVNLPRLGTEPVSPTLQMDSLSIEPSGNLVLFLPHLLTDILYEKSIPFFHI